MDVIFKVRQTHLGLARIAITDGVSEYLEYLPYFGSNGTPRCSQEVVWQDDRRGLRVSIRVYPNGEAVFSLGAPVDKALRAAA